MSQQPDNDYFVSVVAPIRDCAPILADFVDRAAAILSERWGNWEIVLVGDGPDAATEGAVGELLARQPHLRYLRLSRPAGDQAATNVGLENAIGDCVVAMSVWNDPPEMIPQAVSLARDRNAAAFGRREKQPEQKWWDRTGSRYIHRYCQTRLGTDLPHNATGLVSLPRRELNALLKIRDQRHPVLISLYTGYPHVTFNYEPLDRRPTRPGFFDRLKLAYDIMVAGHLHPLRVVSTVALLLSLANLIYLLYIFVVFFFFPQVEAGWSSLSVQNSVMFFFLFLVLAVLSEYVGRLVRHGLDWPRVFIADERNSSVVSRDDRLNVIKE